MSQSHVVHFENSCTLLQRQNAEKIEVSSHEIIIPARRELPSSAAFQVPELSGHQSFVLRSIVLPLLEFQVLLYSLYHNDQKFQDLLKFKLPKPQYRSSWVLFRCPRILRTFNSKYSRLAMILYVIYFAALDKLRSSIPLYLANLEHSMPTSTFFFHPGKTCQIFRDNDPLEIISNCMECHSSSPSCGS
jgi:hypothetical protein